MEYFDEFLVADTPNSSVFKEQARVFIVVSFQFMFYSSSCSSLPQSTHQFASKTVRLSFKLFHRYMKQLTLSRNCTKYRKSFQMIGM
jgi:hypothetical protein